MDKSEFLNSSKRKTKQISYDDGQEFHIRKLSQGELERLKRDYSKDEKALEGIRFVVCKCLCSDENGTRWLDDKDMAQLAELDADLVQHIAAEVLEFSGITKPDTKKN